MPCNLKSCCCFNLKTGSMIIGVLELVFVTIALIRTTVNPHYNGVEGVVEKISFILGIVSAAMLILGVNKVSKFIFLSKGK